MDNFLMLFAFFGGLILFLGIGYFIGHILQLDKWHEKNQKNSKKLWRD